MVTTRSRRRMLAASTENSKELRVRVDDPAYGPAPQGETSRIEQERNDDLVQKPTRLAQTSNATHEAFQDPVLGPEMRAKWSKAQQDIYDDPIRGRSDFRVNARFLHPPYSWSSTSSRGFQKQPEKIQ